MMIAWEDASILCASHRDGRVRTGVPVFFWGLLYPRRQAIKEMMMSEIKLNESRNKSSTISFKPRRSMVVHSQSLLALEWLSPRFHAYQPDCWWVGTFNLVVRLCQSSLLAVFAHQPIQAALASGITQVAICVQCNLEPYRRKSDNTTALYAQWLVFVWFASFFMYIIGTFDGLPKVVVGLFCVIPTVAFVAHAIHSAIKDVTIELARDHRSFGLRGRGRVKDRQTYQKGDFIFYEDGGKRRRSLSEHDFRMLYEPSFEPANDQPEGFDLWRPTGKIWAHKLSGAEVKMHFSTGQLITSHGVCVNVRAGDFLTMPYPEADGLTVIEKESFAAKYMDVSFAVSAAAGNTRGARVPSQGEVLAQWQSILKNDRQYRKTTKMHAKPALEDGIVETIVDGVVEDRKSCKRGDFIVIGSRGGRYAMSELSFATRYDRTRPEPATDPTIAEDGFRLYSPIGSIWAHALTTSEASTCFPTGRFKSKWGGLLTVKVGDCLAMPYPAADEIYVIPKQLFASAYKLKAKDDHVPSQGEALMLWRSVLQEKGQIYCRSDNLYFKRAAVNGMLAGGARRRSKSNRQLKDEGAVSEEDEEADEQDSAEEAGGTQAAQEINSTRRDSWQLGCWGVGDDLSLFCGEVPPDTGPRSET